MSDCCSSSSNTKNTSLPCPSCAHAAKAVATRTLLHQLSEPWSLDGEQQFFFCAQTACNTVYFSDAGQQILSDALRQAVGIKDEQPDSLLCYCFNISKAQYAANTDLKNYVKNQTAAGLCACDTHNPSGKCCLKDFK